MSYIESNREAWNEAFEYHQKGYEANPIADGLDNKWAYITNDLRKELEQLGLEGKDIAQVCCNNGREILSVVNSGAKSGTGFDISMNFIEEAGKIAERRSINCAFYCSSIQEIDEQFKNSYDIVFSTIGAICWFQDLNEFFDKVHMILKPDGVYILSENHPVTNMFAMEGEDIFDRSNPDKIIYSYFRSEPWIENDGMDYVGNSKYQSKTFTSFSHTLSDVLNSMTQNGISLVKLIESNHNLHGFDSLEHGKVPLSMLIVGKRNES